MAAEIRRRGGTRLTATWHPGEDGPEGFYLGLGFRLTGEMSGDEKVGELELGKADPTGGAVHLPHVEGSSL